MTRPTETAPMTGPIIPPLNHAIKAAIARQIPDTRGMPSIH